MHSPITSCMDRNKITERLYQAAIWGCLVTALALMLLLVTAYRAQAQWSTDPAAPMVVCNAANSQRHLTAISDADSGYFAFWSDLRNDAARAQLYGQHFDSEGNALWAANGELLWDQPGRSVNQTAALLLPDGSVLVSFFSGASVNAADTVWAMRFNTDGSAMWAGPSTLLVGLDYRSMQLVASGDCAFLVAYCEGCSGGGYGCRMQRLHMDGTTDFPLPGQPVGANYIGPYSVDPDGAGGIVFNIRCANGAGTCLKAQRFDSLGIAVWPAYLDVADANGLAYGFTTAKDDEGALTSVWEYYGDLRMNRIDTTGSSLWSPAVVPVCEAASGQGALSAMVHDGSLFTSWFDDRTDSSGLYVQRHDLATGAPQWSATGLPVIIESVYIPTSRLVPSDSGAVIAIMDMSGPHMYCAMRVRPDGTLAWEEAVSFATVNGPFYELRTELPDGNGGVVSFWESPDGNLYGARIYRNGKLYNDVGVHERDTLGSVRAWPNPTNGRITFEIPANEQLIGIEVLNTLGSMAGRFGRSTTIDTSSLPTGTYTARIQTSSSAHTVRFIKD